MSHPNMQPQPTIGMSETSLTLRHASPEVQAALGRSVLGLEGLQDSQEVVTVEEIEQTGELSKGGVGAAAAALNKLGTTGNALANAGALPGESAPTVRMVLLGLQTLGHHYEARKAGFPPSRAVVAALKTTITGRPPLELYALADNAVGPGEDNADGGNSHNGDVEEWMLVDEGLAPDKNAAKE